MADTQTAYDLVIANGRVIDPESSLDAVRQVGIRDGTVVAVTEEAISGGDRIDATSLVVAPGFIDLHSHGQDQENYAIQARDGVTTALELELGTVDVDGWYAAREGIAAINYGSSVGHGNIRMKVMKDPGEFLPVADAAHRLATEEEIDEMKRLVERGLRQGAVAVGLFLQYTPATSRWEVLEMFRVAARFGAVCHVHIRNAGLNEPAGAVSALEELVAASAITGAPLHMVHVSSTGLRATPRVLQMIEELQHQGLDVTTECYPYPAALTHLEGAIFDEGWQDILGIDYGDLEWTETGERLTESTFASYREVCGMVIIHMIPEDIVLASVSSPLTMIATDGLVRDGKGHPRTAGSYARVLGRFVRDRGALSLSDAIKKSSLMPAQRMEARVPAMSKKGRVSAGADADLVIFDLETVIDRATYKEPTLPSEGMRHVLVNGVPVVRDGELRDGMTPGRPVRAPTA